MSCIRTLRIAVLATVALGLGAAAHAQSAIDGFNPGANDAIASFAALPDGQILAVGNFTRMGGGGTGGGVRNRIARLHHDGTLDNFNPGANGSVLAVAVQADGKILVGGDFTMLGGGTGTTPRNHLGRLNADGSVDVSFNPNVDNEVRTIAVQPDGRILVGGVFTAIGATTRNRLARLNADGSLDPGFNPGANSTVATLVVQPNGQIVVGGFFTKLGGGTGATVRNSIGRVNADGSLDASFDPGANATVLTVVVQADGKILVSGTFTLLGGGGAGTTPRSHIGRLNANGSLDTSFDPGASGTVFAVTVQADGKILVGGDFLTLGGGGTGVTSRIAIGRLNANGSIDASFNPGVDKSVFALVLQPDGKILAGGTFTILASTARSQLGRLYADGSLDGDFNPGSNSYIYGMALQADGQIVVGGQFTTLGGAGTTARSHLARLNAAGQIDSSFNPGANSTVTAIAVQPDGKIVVAGDLTMLGGGGSGTTARGRLGRLNADGSLDTGFNPGTDSTVYAVAVQPDGKIIVAGAFTLLGGGGSGTTARSRIGRLNADGSLDTSFNPGANNTVEAVALQPDGKILVGGDFTMLGGGGLGTTPRNHIGRLNPDGSLDVSFAPAADSSVYSLAVQANGQILLGGSFTALDNGGTGALARRHIARLNADGSIDTGFNPGANDNVYAVAVQTDGKILVAGLFTLLGGGGSGTTTRNHIGRVSANDILDPNFDPGANGFVGSLLPLPDGKVVVGGLFTTLGGGGTGTVSRANIGRLANSAPAADTVSVLGGGTAISWARSGSGPELSRVTFDTSTDGTTYTPLGSASRAPGGWRLAGLTLPTNQNLFLRARGYYASGALNGSGSIVESIRNTVAVPCTYALSASSASVPSGVNAGAVTLTTNDACPWTAPNNAFITVTSASAGSGTTAVTWVTGINPSPAPRSAAIAIAGLPFTITQAGASTTRRVPNDFNHDGISDVAVFRPGLGRWFIMGQPNTDWGAPGDMPVPGDYNGDGNPDLAVFRPSNGTWYVNGGATVMWGLPGDIPVPGDYDGDHITDMAVFRPGTGQWIVRNVGTFAWGLGGDLPVAADYNGDGLTDIAVYRPSNGTWYIRNVTTVAWGSPGDIPVPADYDGDGTADIAVFIPSIGVWLVMGQYMDTWGAAGDVPVAMDRSGDGAAELGVFRRATGEWFFRNRLADSNELVVWGGPGDIPLGRSLPPVATLAGDFDGDRKADLTVFRPSTGDWITLRSLSGFGDHTQHTFGLSSDTPVARDYDGDGKIDPAVYRPSTGRWYMLRSSTNFTDYLVQDWGLSSDIPVPGDYDGDGKADVAVFRPSLGRWLIVLSSTGNTSSTSLDFGLNGDIPVPADYDGDGRTDIAVFRPSTGDWYIYNRVTATYQVITWGLTGDVPAPADFDGDGKADLAVFRPSLGRWVIKSSIDGTYVVIDWGLSGDVVVPADFDGDGKADVAVFRPSTGFWYVRGQFNRSWGLAGDKSGIKIP